MKKTNKNNNPKQAFLSKMPLEKGYSKGHKEYLGMNVPENFFTDSKKAILNSVSEFTETKPSRRFLLTNNLYKLSVAASFAILLTGTFLFLFYKTTFFNQNSFAEENLSFENDIAFNSLFVDDNTLDDYIDNYLIEDIIFEAEYAKDNVIINSLLMEDTEVNDYIDEYLIEQLIL